MLKPSNALKPSNSRAQAGPKKVLALAFENGQVLDLTGPLEALDKANQAADEPVYTVRVVAAQAGPLRTSGWVNLDIAESYESLDPASLAELDTLIVTGGRGAIAAAGDPALLAFVRRAAGAARRVVSICTGAFVLAELGLLDGRRATTHWFSVDELAARYPAVSVEPDAIYVQDGKVWTSAGVTAGIDLTLALVEQDLGRDIALAAARDLVVYMMRPGGQAQFSAQLKFQKPADRRLAELLEWIEANPSADLSIPALAARCAMSERHFARRFTEEAGVSPARFVEQSRLDQARRRLEESDTAIELVAAHCGFNSAEVLRRLFQRHLGLSPSDYRARFRTSVRSQRKEALP